MPDLALLQDIAALQALFLAQQTEIERMQLVIAKLRRMQFE